MKTNDEILGLDEKALIAEKRLINKELRVLKLLRAEYKKAIKSQYYNAESDQLITPAHLFSRDCEISKRSTIYTFDFGLCWACGELTLMRLRIVAPRFCYEYYLVTHEYKWRRGLLTPRVNALNEMIKKLSGELRNGG